MHRLALVIGVVIALESAGCETCDAPVNADMTVVVALEANVQATGTLYLVATDGSGTALANDYVGSDLQFPYEEMWSGNCDEGQMPPGTYTVTAWLDEAPETLTPPPGAPQGSAQFDVLGTNEHRRVDGTVYITISNP